jgi:hypothetical protein
MFRTAFLTSLIILALALVLPPPSSAAGSPADDMANEFAAVVCKDGAAAGTEPKFKTIPIGPAQEAMGASATEGNLHKEAIRAPREGANPKDLSREAGQREGGNKPAPADLCRNTHLQPAYLIYKNFSHAPTIPGDAAEIDMQLNRGAQAQLDAIAAAKLKNKTTEQKTSGQQPP